MLKEPISYPYYSSSSWTEAWASSSFRKKAILGTIVFATIMILLPHFFTIIEARNGVVLNDWLLEKIPAHDCSVALFIFLWSTGLLALIRSIQQPAIFIRIIYLLIVIQLARVLTITSFPFDPPIGIIRLKDPLTSLTYGGRELFISKDLFFSGHTSNLFMIYLSLHKKRDKQYALLATILIATMVLIQHIHYSIDVIAAFVFTYPLVKFSRRLKFLTI